MLRLFVYVLPVDQDQRASPQRQMYERTRDTSPQRYQYNRAVDPRANPHSEVYDPRFNPASPLPDYHNFPQPYYRHSDGREGVSPQPNYLHNQERVCVSEALSLAYQCRSRQCIK
jgi:hypothetical protein